MREHDLDTDDELTAAPLLLVVGSGDGTASELAGRLAYRDTVLGVLPLGTTNNLARSLGLPLELKDAIDVIAEGRVATADLGAYHSARPVARDASIGDDRLTVFALGDEGKLSALASSVGFSVGPRRQVDDEQYLRLTDAVIETDPTQEVEVDGEIKARTPVHVGVARDALRVLVPVRQAQGSDGGEDQRA